MRWDPYFPYTDTEGRLPCFERSKHLQRYPNAPLGLLFANDPGCPAGTVFSKRISMYPDKNQTGHGIYAYAWYVWDRTYDGEPQIKWIPPQAPNESDETLPEPPKAENPKRLPKLISLEPDERRRRIAATTLIHADVLDALRDMPPAIADVMLFDCPYPCIKRPYGTMTEEEWHDLMEWVLYYGHKIAKPQGSIVVILQPNKETVGRMRRWPYQFVSWATQMWRDWGLVQDHYSFLPNAIPCAGADRKGGLMRQSVKWAVWLGRADCHRNQDAVLEEPAEATLDNYRTDHRSKRHLGPHCINRDTFRRTLEERGGVTPHNMLTVRTGSSNHGHPAITSYELANWWCRYVLPPGGVLLDPFCGTGTTLLAALDCGASRVIGIDKEVTYLEEARRRIVGEDADQLPIRRLPESDGA